MPITVRTVIPRTAIPRTALLKTAVPRIAILRTAVPRTVLLKTAIPRIAALRTAIQRIAIRRTKHPIRAEATADNLDGNKLPNVKKSIRYLRERLQEISCNLFLIGNHSIMLLCIREIGRKGGAAWVFRQLA